MTGNNDPAPPRKIGGSNSDDPCVFEETLDLSSVDVDNAKGLAAGKFLTVNLRRQQDTTSVICRRNDNSKYVGSVFFGGR